MLANERRLVIRLSGGDDSDDGMQSACRASPHWKPV